MAPGKGFEPQFTSKNTSSTLFLKQQVRWDLNPKEVGGKNTKRQLSRKLSANQRQMEISPAIHSFSSYLVLLHFWQIP